jgi:hypothetical protein
MSIEIIIGFIVIIAFAIWSFIYLKKKSDINVSLFELIPNIFPSIGILGTFVGIAIGLSNFDLAKPDESISVLLEGLKTAFFVSILGVLLLIIFSIYSSIQKKKNNVLSEETEAIIELKNVLIEIRENLTQVDDNNNKVKLSNIIRDTFKESKKQTELLQAFSSDLALKIEAGFEKILNNPNEGVTHELKKLKTAIDSLGSKLQDPTTEMTQSVVNELRDSMAKMVEEFKTSMSGNTKNELEKLSTLMTTAGNSLSNFPDRFQNMMDSMNENFKGIQNVFEQISNQTITQSELSTETMKTQITEISEIVKNRVGDLQMGQEKLINQQTQNINVSEQLVEKYNLSVDRMGILTKTMNDTLEIILQTQSELKLITNNLRSSTELSNSSINTLSDSQTKIIQYSNDFILKNNDTIVEINNSLELSKQVSTDYSTKFSTIQNGLQSIFSEIQNGLDMYRTSISTSTEDYLGKYTDVLTKTIQMLNNTLTNQKEILEELSIQIGTLNKNKN